MRGQDMRTGSIFSYVDIEERVPASHPLRKIREFVNAALAALDAAFAKLYSTDGRPSIAPERLLRAALIQILFSIRSERQLMEQMQYNLLFRWFVGLGIDDPVWVPTVFTKNRDRLLNTDIARQFLAAILAHKDVAPLLSDEHFSVDGTLIEAWASMKSFQPKAGADGSEPPAAGSGGEGQAPVEAQASEPAAPAETPAADKGRNAEVNFHGQKRSNETHASVTDPDARLYRKGDGKEAKLCVYGPCLDGKPQRSRGRSLPHPCGRPRRTECRAGHDRAPRRTGLSASPWAPIKAMTPRLRQRAEIHERDAACGGEGQGLGHRRPHNAARRLRSSQRIRKRIEEPFGWSKTVGPGAKTMLRGLDRAGGQFIFNLAAYNLVRLPKLLAA